MMARKLYILAIFLAAASVGVLGFQAFDYLIAGSWPAVPVQFVWDSMFGPMADTKASSLGRMWDWVGAVPVAVLGFALAYGVFLLSDTLRRR